jgi:protein CpxP
MQTKHFIGLALVPLGLLALFGQVAHAQTNAMPTQTRPAHMSLEQRLERAADQLGLTQDQRTQIKGILVSARQQIKTVRQDSSLTPDQRKAQTKTILKSARKEAAAILTPAQRQEWKTLKADWKQKS